MRLYVKEIRIQKNLSIRELAKLSEVAKSHIERMENNSANPTIAVLCKLAKALDVSVHDLFSCD